MRWDELSKDLMVWTIPGTRTKNKEVTVVPLSAAVRKIILAMLQTLGELIFPGEDGRPFGNWSKSKMALNEASGVANCGCMTFGGRRLQASKLSECRSRSTKRF